MRAYKTKLDMQQRNIDRNPYILEVGPFSFSDSKTNSLANVDTVLRFPANPFLSPVSQNDNTEEASKENRLDTAVQIMEIRDAERFEINVPKGKLDHLPFRLDNFHRRIVPGGPKIAHKSKLL